eukprot:7389328-Prorocentrum_lima.AAC.1
MPSPPSLLTLGRLFCSPELLCLNPASSHGFSPRPSPSFERCGFFVPGGLLSSTARPPFLWQASPTLLHRLR